MNPLLIAGVIGLVAQLRRQKQKTISTGVVTTPTSPSVVYAGPPQEAYVHSGGTVVEEEEIAAELSKDIERVAEASINGGKDAVIGEYTVTISSYPGNPGIPIQGGSLAGGGFTTGYVGDNVTFTVSPAKTPFLVSNSNTLLKYKYDAGTKVNVRINILPRLNDYYEFHHWSIQPHYPTSEGQYELPPNTAINVDILDNTLIYAVFQDLEKMLIL